jgi:hypothetical protein|mmetsp:Transcript_12190/g.14427  ORF Transcript_12190/g.14427 Transcript_12190/m.14427 type:complete len:80 (+) Transcript_12190:731-970(+)
MVPFFFNERMTLSGKVSNYFQYQVVQRTNQYSNNPIYSDQLTTGLLEFSTQMLTGYQVVSGSSSSLPFSDFGPDFSADS